MLIKENSILGLRMGRIKARERRRKGQKKKRKCHGFLFVVVVEEETPVDLYNLKNIRLVRSVLRHCLGRT